MTDYITIVEKLKRTPSFQVSKPEDTGITFAGIP